MKNLKLFKGYFGLGLISPSEEFNGWRFVKQPRALVRLFLRVAPLVIGRLTPTWASAIYTISKEFRRISKAQGAPGMVKYLKVLYIITQQAAGGYKISDLSQIGPRVARTAGGLPRIILKSHRQGIRRGDPWTIRLYLTMFGLYRVIDMPGKVKINTIVALGLFSQKSLGEISLFLPIFWTYLCRLVSNKVGPKWDETRPVTLAMARKILGFKPETADSPTLRPRNLVLTTKCGPVSGPLTFLDAPLWATEESLTFRSPYTRISAKGATKPLMGTPPLLKEGLYHKTEINKIYQKAEVVTSNSGAIFWTLAIWMNSNLKPLLDRWISIYQADVVKDLFDIDKFPANSLVPWGQPGMASPMLGKLAFLDEPAGKVRVVAMVDIITQSLFKPLHDWLFSLLRRIPQDGTFDQWAPVQVLLDKGIKDVFSYDLSAATDRLPLSLQESLIGWLIGEESASIWATLLVGRIYSISPVTAEKRGLASTSYKYGAGQPMGAYSSWAMLALTHHFCVQYAAWQVKVCKGLWFTDYAVLGDDVIIGHKAVAEAYHLFMTKTLHVEIQLAKCMLSSNGSFEFAKRTVVRNADATPVSLKGFIGGLKNLPVMEGILTKLGIDFRNSISRVLRALGYGYKALGRINSALSTDNRLRGALIFLSRPGGLCGLPFTRWISQHTWNQENKELTNEKVTSIAQSLIEFMVASVRKEIVRRIQLVTEQMRLPYLPNTLFPGERYHDLFKDLFLNPLQTTLRAEVPRLEVISRQLARGTIESHAELDKLFVEVTSVMENLSALPKDGNVSIRGKDLLPTGISTIRLWKRFRKVVKN